MKILPSYSASIHIEWYILLILSSKLIWWRMNTKRLWSITIDNGSNVHIELDSLKQMIRIWYFRRITIQKCCWVPYFGSCWNEFRIDVSLKNCSKLNDLRKLYLKKIKIDQVRTWKLTFITFWPDMVINNFDFGRWMHCTSIFIITTWYIKLQNVDTPLFMHVSKDWFFYFVKLFCWTMIIFYKSEINNALLRKYLYKTV